MGSFRHFYLYAYLNINMDIYLCSNTYIEPCFCSVFFICKRFTILFYGILKTALQKCCQVRTRIHVASLPSPMWIY